MDRLGAMRTFLTVVEHGSFSRAAERLRCSNSSVTDAVMKLEKHLGVRLLNRTTRQVSPTWEGRQYYERVKQILADIDDVELAIGDLRSTPRGRLSLEVPAALGHAYIIPALPRFAEAFPHLETLILLSPRPSNVFAGKVDLSVQFGDLSDPGVVAQKICDTRHVACASPEFLARRPEPRHPKDLGDLDCLGFLSPDTGQPLKWTFERGHETCRHEPSGTLQTNSSEALIDFARRGAGIVYLPDILVRPMILTGSLRQVLPGWTTMRRALYLVRPHKRYASAKVRVFAKFIQETFAGIPGSSGHD